MTNPIAKLQRLFQQRLAGIDSWSAPTGDVATYHDQLRQSLVTCQKSLGDFEQWWGLRNLRVGAEILAKLLCVHHNRPLDQLKGKKLTLSGLVNSQLAALVPAPIPDAIHAKFVCIHLLCNLSHANNHPQPCDVRDCAYHLLDLCDWYARQYGAVGSDYPPLFAAADYQEIIAGAEKWSDEQWCQELAVVAQACGEGADYEKSSFAMRRVAEQALQMLFPDKKGEEIDFGLLEITKITQQLEKRIPRRVLTRLACVGKLSNRSAHHNHPFCRRDLLLCWRHLSEVIAWLATSAPHASSYEFPALFIYWTLVVKCRPVKPPSALYPQLRHNPRFDFWGLQSYDGNDYLVWNRRQQREMKRRQIESAGWAGAEICPSFLESYATIDASRFTPQFKSQRQFLRLEFAPATSYLSLPETGARVSGWLLTLTDEDNAIITLQIALPPSSLKAVLSWNRTDFRDGVNHGLLTWLAALPCIKQVFASEIRDYQFIVVREAEHFQTNGTATVAADIAPFYSLFIGVERAAIAEATGQQFLARNQSTRPEVFMAVNKQRAILVEGKGRQAGFTRARLVDQPPPELVQARESYNDLNYLVWLEILLALDRLVASRQASKKSTGKFYQRIYGKAIARHSEPNESWVDAWKSEFGLDERYRQLPDGKLSDWWRRP